MEVLCVRCKLKEDVAGATFLAFGTAAAEILISCITIVHGGVYIDVGIGSIIGYLLFNFHDLQSQLDGNSADPWNLCHDFGEASGDPKSGVPA